MVSLRHFETAAVKECEQIPPFTFVKSGLTIDKSMGLPMSLHIPVNTYTEDNAT